MNTSEMTLYTRPDHCYSLAGRRGARHLARLYDRHFASFGISSSQYSILAYIDFKPEITTAELAEAMIMERTTLVRALEPLMRAGWVQRAATKKGRASCLVLTQAGKTKFADAEPAWRQAQDEFESQFGKERAAMLRAILLSVPIRGNEPG